MQVCYSKALTLYVWGVMLLESRLGWVSKLQSNHKTKLWLILKIKWCLTSLVAQRVKHLPAMQKTRVFDPWVRKIPWRRKWQPTPVLLPGKSHRWRSLVGYSPWDCKELDVTEWLHFTLKKDKKQEKKRTDRDGTDRKYNRMIVLNSTNHVNDYIY